ncbi:PREDICTED: ribosomal RNA-processing protein 17 [Nelumbo nucifera]|uniref:Ribosomal RNA-processing protein 17 n=2 Tax=Nelumbo nucifera TaxID=4432 RepID=A0A822ZI18_NELNU|nr:PREDICTED: ribosomal RNA-processing protein 17 [Nelumbo nucifera]DAD45754.1 TPA_asm: hypothetical protein HUJ06_003984 [Nelumbo nucifera]
MEELEEVAVGQIPRTNARHIKKRALKNKALSVTFNEKDLRDFVTGFHKRKKKRRKEAQHKLQEKERLRRIQARKQRKLERDLALYGGAQPATDAGVDEGGDDIDQEEGTDPTTSISVEGTSMYDNGDMTITVTMSEISREEDADLRPKTQLIPRSSIGGTEKRHQIPLNKKTFKKSQKHKPLRRPQKKRDKKKGKKNKKH